MSKDLPPIREDAELNETGTGHVLADAPPTVVDGDQLAGCQELLLCPVVDLYLQRLALRMLLHLGKTVLAQGEYHRDRLLLRHHHERRR